MQCTDCLNLYVRRLFFLQTNDSVDCGSQPFSRRGPSLFLYFRVFKLNELLKVKRLFDVYLCDFIAMDNIIFYYYYYYYYFTILYDIRLAQKCERNL